MSASNREIERTLRQAEDLSMFPQVATRIREVVDDPSTSLVDLESVVSLDTSLSAQVLKLANSAFFGLARSVASLKQALFILGFHATRDLTLALATMSTGRNESATHQLIWERSVRTAAAAQFFALQVDWDRSEAFVAGMLHDIGKLILLEIHPYLYEDILLFAESPQTLIETEDSTFDFDHAELGAAALEKWDLPQRTVTAVRSHHREIAIGDMTGPLKFAAVLGLCSELAELTIGPSRIPARDAAKKLSTHRHAIALDLDANNLYLAVTSPLPELG